MIWTKTVKDRVKQLLMQYPSCRDNDQRLKWNYWFFQLKHEHNSDMNEVSATSFAHLQIKGKLTDGDVITRARRKMQEEHPELRGYKYAERQGKMQNKAKEELKLGGW